MAVALSCKTGHMLLAHAYMHDVKLTQLLSDAHTPRLAQVVPKVFPAFSQQA